MCDGGGAGGFAGDGERLCGAPVAGGERPRRGRHRRDRGGAAGGGDHDLRRRLRVQHDGVGLLLAFGDRQRVFADGDPGGVVIGDRHCHRRGGESPRRRGQRELFVGFVEVVVDDGDYGGGGALAFRGDAGERVGHAVVGAASGGGARRGGERHRRRRLDGLIERRGHRHVAGGLSHRRVCQRHGECGGVGVLDSHVHVVDAQRLPVVVVSARRGVADVGGAAGDAGDGERLCGAPVAGGERPSRRRHRRDGGGAARGGEDNLGGGLGVQHDGVGLLLSLHHSQRVFADGDPGGVIIGDRHGHRRGGESPRRRGQRERFVCFVEVVVDDGDYGGGGALAFRGDAGERVGHAVVGAASGGGARGGGERHRSRRLDGLVERRGHRHVAGGLSHRRVCQ